MQDAAPRERLRLAIAGPDSVLMSSLCARCPYSPAGCCVAPPRYDWSDLGRVVVHGGAAWLFEQVQQKRLLPVEHGLAVRREKRRVTQERGAPRLATCTFHDGTRGCTITPEMRPSTCNFYLCDRALDAAAEDPASAPETARAVHDGLVADFVRWDAVLAARVREQWPPAQRYTPEFFAWLGEAFAQLARHR